MKSPLEDIRRRTFFFLWSLTGDYHLAEDLTQDAFESLLQSAHRQNEGAVTEAEFLDGFNDHDHVAFAAMRIGRRRIANQGRRSRNAQRLRALKSFAEKRGLDPVDPVVLQEFVAALQAAVDGLPTDQRAALAAKLTRTQRKLAQQLHVSPDTVARRASAAIATLRRRLRDWEVDPELWSLAAIADLLFGDDDRAEND